MDEYLTATAIIIELITANFVPNDDYMLFIHNTQVKIGCSQTAASGNAADDSVIRVVEFAPG